MYKEFLINFFILHKDNLTSEVKENNTFYANFVQRNINYPHGIIDIVKNKNKSDLPARLVICVLCSVCCMVLHGYIKILF